MTDNIFQPNFKLTAATNAAFKQIDRLRWLIDKMLLMPKHQAWIRREVEIERVAATVRIEGAGLEDADVNNLRKKVPAGPLTDSQRANLDAISAYEFIDYLSDLDDLRIDELVVRQMNREFIKSFPEKMPGQYRAVEIGVGPFSPPDAIDVPACMRPFSRWLRREQKELNPITRAGLAHIHLVAIHPFEDGNGRTARGLATLILQRSPLNFRNLLSLERMIDINKTEYFSVIEKTLGKSFSQDYDATPWLDFFSRMILAEAMRLEGKLTDWHRSIEQIHNEMTALGINDRQADGLVYAARTGRITRPDYMEITGASGPTASRDLAELAKRGWLKPRGNTRARVYHYPVDEKQLLLFSGSKSDEVVND